MYDTRIICSSRPTVNTNTHKKGRHKFRLRTSYTGAKPTDEYWILRTLHQSFRKQAISTGLLRVGSSD